MGTEEKDPLKEIDWKDIGDSTTRDFEAGRVVNKRLPKKIRQIPDYYFLSRRALSSSVAFYGAWIVAGVGAGMLIETWINKKIKEDGGVIWEFDNRGQIVLITSWF
ncbi:unnamed protein product [Fraxinus pennsylvanica]|uniref:Uncharacterized protein n=1 Tax=Fraxinus pennsylvanica TaxID=56036 RepID=A0AAD2A8Q3_9LAMI|nr:unnamed protein product [Fraxinus pennsylvanica]